MATWIKQELKELDIYLDDLCQQVHKDAGNLWIQFSDKFEAFKKRLLDESTPTVPGSVETDALNYINDNRKPTYLPSDIQAAYIAGATSQPSSPVPEDVIEGLLNDFKFNDLGEYTFTRVEIKTLMQIVAGHAYKGQQGDKKYNDFDLAVYTNLVKEYIKDETGYDSLDQIYGHFTNGKISYSDIIKEQPTIPLSVIDQLIYQNPWKEDKDGQCYHAFGTGYTTCVSKLRELLQSQPVPESVDALKTIEVSSCPKHGGTTYFDDCELCKLEKMTESIHYHLSVDELCKQLEEKFKTTFGEDYYSFYAKPVAAVINILHDLLQVKIITTPQAISDVWDAAQDYGCDIAAFGHSNDPDKATYLKQKFNIDFPTHSDKEVKP